MTPLHVAAEKGYVKIVDYLVSKGAEINIQDNKGVIICDCFVFEFELDSYVYMPIEFKLGQNWVRTHCWNNSNGYRLH